MNPASPGRSIHPYGPSRRCIHRTPPCSIGRVFEIELAYAAPRPRAPRADDAVPDPRQQRHAGRWVGGGGGSREPHGLGRKGGGEPGRSRGATESRSSRVPRKTSAGKKGRRKWPRFLATTGPRWERKCFWASFAHHPKR